jgi:hypothetical protein
MTARNDSSKMKTFLLVFALTVPVAPASAQHVQSIHYPETIAIQRSVGLEYETDRRPEPPGWTYVEGGLLEDPVWFNAYKRQNPPHFYGDGNAWFVIINWKLPRKPNSQQGHFRLTDTQLITYVKKEATVSLWCEPPETNVFIRVMAVVTPDRGKWWRNIHEAWKINLEDGMVSYFPSRGVKCNKGPFAS